MTCQATSDDFDWDVSVSEFVCVSQVAFIIGGQDEDHRYLDHVEVWSPYHDCKSSEDSRYPIKVTGLSGTFWDGQLIACGGALEDYVQCRTHAEQSQICQRNVECVGSDTQSKWCTGPKVSACYTFDPIFTRVIELTKFCQALLKAHAISHVGLVACS